MYLVVKVFSCKTQEKKRKHGGEFRNITSFTIVVCIPEAVDVTFLNFEDKNSMIAESLGFSVDMKRGPY